MVEMSNFVKGALIVPLVTVLFLENIAHTV